MPRKNKFFFYLCRDHKKKKTSKLKKRESEKEGERKKEKLTAEKKERGKKH